ncbi:MULTISPECIES: hypothetical protein [Thiorhodovibrio]|uniref:hypothetical protein n=1 Tax=Thiorhodovibrio TaxID=61593 RepID=UPI001A912F2D|nr:MULTISPECIES: hypothetical protein [Thiorhodovibrio]MBK5968902.1 hypothetical protein [Thiorhodovibrio winogradskyi]
MPQSPLARRTTCARDRLALVFGGAKRAAMAQRRLHQEARNQQLKYSPASYLGGSSVTAKPGR